MHEARRQAPTISAGFVTTLHLIVRYVLAIVGAESRQPAHADDPRYAASTARLREILAELESLREVLRAHREQARSPAAGPKPTAAQPRRRVRHRTLRGRSGNAAPAADAAPPRPVPHNLLN